MAYSSYAPRPVPSQQGIQSQPAYPAYGNGGPTNQTAVPQNQFGQQAYPTGNAVAPAQPYVAPAYSQQSNGYPIQPEAPATPAQGNGISRENYINTQNGNIHGKNVVLDVRMSLYAAPANKVGEVVDSDFSRGVWSATDYSGENHVLVSANTDVSIPLAVFWCALQNAFRKVSGVSTAPASAGVIQVSEAGLSQLQNALLGWNQAFSSFSYESMVNSYCQVSNAFGNLNPTQPKAPSAAGTSNDFFFTQGKINGRKVGQDGFAPTSFITIERNGMRGNEPARYPWKVSIDNCECRLVRGGDGKTQTYDGKSARNKKTVTVNSTDGDMLAMLFHSMVYTGVFANVMCGPIMENAMKTLAAQRTN